MKHTLTLDIETSPNKGYAFKVWQHNMLSNQIIEPTYMLSWAAKWGDAKQSQVIYRKCTDVDFLSKLHELMSKADLIVTYNGDKFDLRHINREFVEQGLPRTRPCASVDMFKVVKKMFNFPHNSLDYVCSVLLGVKKLETGGFDLWPAFMKGDPKAERTMERYNKKDVVLTEKLYRHLKGWIPNHPHTRPHHLVIIDDEDQDYDCSVCGSHKITRHRPRRTRCFAIRTYQCDSCGAWHDGKRKKLS